MKIWLRWVAVFAFLPFMVSAQEAPIVSVETEVSRNISATAGYVVFFLEASGDSMEAAKIGFDRKWNAFEELCRKDFPQVELEVFAVNVGTREFNSFRAAETPVVPAIGKVILCTLPPDEGQAVKLLDAGTRAGLTPFCSASRDGAFGAVFYGVTDPDKALDELYPIALKALWKEAERLANALGRSGLEISSITRYTPSDSGYELRFKDIRVVLPARFCGSDKDRIKVSLILRAGFKTAGK